MDGTKQKIKCGMHWMTRSDLVRVMEIEDRTGGVMSRDDFCFVLKHMNTIGTVAEVNFKVVGFMIYELNKSYIRLLTIAVHPEYQRCGIASQMMGKLFSKLSKSKRPLLKVEVCEDNLGMCLFLRSMGIRCDGSTGTWYRFRYKIND